MELTKAFWHEETQAKKRQFYTCPLAKKKPRVSPLAEPNGEIKQFTKEQVFWENLKRFARLGWKGDSLA